MNPAVAHYDRNAVNLAARYDRLRFEAVHSALLAYLPPPPARILDIGSGSGRDAIALAEKGFSVTAVEPAADMLRLARLSAGDAEIEWIDDRLPALGSLAGRGGSFAFILCSAVLMHLGEPELPGAFVTMRRLLAPRGVLGVTVRGAWAGDAPDLFHGHLPESLVAAAAGAGLAPILSVLDDDHLDRQGLTWRTFAFARDTGR
jgi:2-polyprenyl-3-methyl-5-hydroxy-6-metoxy-1,4-benzoquinol methylase